MSRIQDILNKAEREGTARRTRSLSDSPVALAPAPMPAPAPPPPAAWVNPAAAPALDHHTVATATPRLDPHLVAALAPQSVAAEQNPLLRTRLKNAANGRTVRTIIVTSPSMGDGKSVTAANLALTMAQEFHHRVLLIDGDMRRPSVATLFGLPVGPGLADVLMGGVELDAALVNFPDQRLTVLPAGTPPGHPAELLGSSGMRRVLDSLRTRFDTVLLDMPPVAPVADVHVVSPMADGILMIVRAGVTAKPAIERAISGLDVAKVLGLVLNEAGDPKAYTYGYGGYGYIAG